MSYINPETYHRIKDRIIFNKDAEIFINKLSFLTFMKPDDYPKITKYRLYKRDKDSQLGTYSLRVRFIF